MTVAELIEQLQQMDAPDALVVQSKDGEGNGFSPLADLGWGWYYPDSTYSGEYHAAEEAEGEECEFTPEPGDQQAVCLWPTN